MPPLGFGGTEAAEDVVGLEAADEGEGIAVAEGCFAVLDNFIDGGHLGNAAQHFGSEGVPQEAAHNAALMDARATGNTLSLEFVDELVQPEMDGDGARAKCGAM